MEIDSIASKAVEWVKEAGKLSVIRRKESLEISFKSSPSDLVTAVDKDVEAFLISKIEEHFPDHGIVGEEGLFKQDPLDFDTHWIIDPIDGTMNFVHQQINYVISVALVHKGEGVFGIVYDPTRDELFYGEKGHGAYLNGQRLLLNKPVPLSESLVCTSLFWSKRSEEFGLDKLVTELPKNCRGIRIFGCAAMEMVYVAAGRIDAYVSLSLNPWDFAAGKIIVEEAGGTVSTVEGKELFFDHKSSVLVSNPHLYQELFSFLYK